MQQISFSNIATILWFQFYNKTNCYKFQCFHCLKYYYNTSTSNTPTNNSWWLLFKQQQTDVAALMLQNDTLKLLQRLLPILFRIHQQFFSLLQQYIASNTATNKQWFNFPTTNASTLIQILLHEYCWNNKRYFFNIQL